MTNMEGNGDQLPPEAILPTFDRSTIRALVAKDQAELRELAQRGGNVYQQSLDQRDRTRSRIEHLGVEDQTRFLQIYSEETRAVAAATNDEAQALETQAASSQSLGEQIGRGLVGAVIVLTVFALCTR